jgi:hypothetical protein
MARRLFEHLSRMFHERQIFMDVDSIPPGANFPEIIDRRLHECDVFLALIRRLWLTDNNDNRRLDDPNDLLRYEIATALRRREIPVIPVLVNGATMPEGTPLEDQKHSAPRGASGRFRLSCHCARNGSGRVSGGKSRPATTAASIGARGR